MRFPLEFMRVCARSIMYSCTILELHLPFLSDKNCSSVWQFMSRSVCWLIEGKIFYSLKIFTFGQRPIFNLYCTTKMLGNNARLSRPRVIVLHREKIKIKNNIASLCRYANTAIFPIGEGWRFHSQRDIFHPRTDKIINRLGYNRFISLRQWDKVKRANRTWLSFFCKIDSHSRTEVVLIFDGAERSAKICPEAKWMERKMRVA